jgi:hypothetical protein
MKHTKEQLRQMSDFERNKLLAKLVDPNARVYRSIEGSDGITIDGSDYCRIMIDYCNAWNDIMPLAIEYGIMYEISENRLGERLVRAFNIDKTTITPWTAISPQRAIASCLIMVLEGKL